MYNYNTLVSTVGTSLFFPNLSNLNCEDAYQKPPRPDDTPALEDKKILEKVELEPGSDKLREILRDIKKHYIDKDWTLLAKSLIKVPPSLRLCGAEINSIFAMQEKKYLSQELSQMVFLVSDTQEGEDIGKILRAYFENRQAFLAPSDVRVIKVDGLQDANPLQFQREGLVNLVRILGEELRKIGGEYMAINATGGYKAQIALAVAFGQVAKTSVYYKHEKFNQVIPFPRVPFIMDFSVVNKKLELWDFLAEPGKTVSYEEIQAKGGLDEGLGPLFDKSEVGQETVYSISALGQVYWEGFLASNPDIARTPRNATQEERKGCHFPQHHYPDRFKDYVKKIYEDNLFIKECHSIDYSGQKGIQNRTFYLIGKELIGEYRHKDFGARFRMLTTAETPLERNGALKLLLSSHINME